MAGHPIKLRRIDDLSIDLLSAPACFTRLRLRRGWNDLNRWRARDGWRRRLDWCLRYSGRCRHNRSTLRRTCRRGGLGEKRCARSPCSIKLQGLSTSSKRQQHNGKPQNTLYHSLLFANICSFIVWVIITHKQTRVKPGLRATRFTYCKLLRAYCQAFSCARGVAMPRPAIEASTRPRSGRTGPRSWSWACRAILRAVPVDGLRQGSLPSFAARAGGLAGSTSLWRDPR